MTVLHIIKDMNIGGAQKVLYSIIEGIKDYNHIILTFQVCDEYKKLLKNISNVDICIINNMGEFIRTIRNKKYDIVHYHWWPGLGITNSYFNRMNIPVIITLQEQCEPPECNAYYVAGSKSNMKYLHNIPSNRKKYIYFGINPELFPANENRDFSKQIILGRVSTLIPSKIPENLCDVLSKINVLNFAYHIYGIGEKEFVNELHQKINKNNLQNKITIFNDSYVNDKYKNIDIFLYWLEEGEEESFGLIFLEAMAANSIVITKRVGAAEEIIQHGVNGFLFDDESEINNILQRIITDNELRNEIIKNGKNTVYQTFSITHFINEYRLLYEGFEIEKKKNIINV